MVLQLRHWALNRLNSNYTKYLGVFSTCFLKFSNLVPGLLLAVPFRYTGRMVKSRHFLSYSSSEEFLPYILFSNLKLQLPSLVDLNGTAVGVITMTSWCFTLNDLISSAGIKTQVVPATLITNKGITFQSFSLWTW